MRLMGLMLAGPRSRAVLAALTDHDVSNAAFRFMDHRAMDVAGVPAMVNRLSYTGDLGYEIWVEPCYLRTLYRAVQAAGRRRTSGCGRCSRCGWRRTGRPGSPSSGRSTAPSRAGWSGSCGWTRGTSSAATAAAREAEAGPRLRRVSLAIEAEDADVMGDEPIWARVDRDYGAVAPSHGYGAPRFDADGPGGARGRRAAGRRLAGGGLGDLGRLRAFGRACRWRRATCRPRSPSATRRGCSRSRSSASAGRRASWSSRRSTPRGRGCAGDGVRLSRAGDGGERVGA